MKNNRKRFSADWKEHSNGVVIRSAAWHWMTGAGKLALTVAMRRLHTRQNTFSSIPICFSLYCWLDWRSNFYFTFFSWFFCCQRRLRYIWISIGKINTEIVCWHAAESKPFELGWFNQVNCFHLFQFNNLIGIRLKYVEVIQLENLYSWKPRLKELFFEFELLMHRLICNFCIEMIS